MSGEWQSVSETYPEPNERVLIATDNGEVGIDHWEQDAGWLMEIERAKWRWSRYIGRRCPFILASSSSFKTVKWQPAKPRTRIKVVECGPGHWDEQDRGLDLPYPIHTVDFRVTGTGHDSHRAHLQRRMRELPQDGRLQREAAEASDSRLALPTRLLVRSLRHEV